MSVVVKYSDYLIAKNSLTVEEYVNGLDEKFIEEYGDIFFKNKLKKSDLAAILKQITKVKEICFEERQNEPQMFTELLEKYLKSGNINPEEIDYIIYTRGNPYIGDSKTPYFLREINTPYFLQKEFNLKNASVFSIEQECSASLLAVKLAESLIKHNSARRVLILSSSFQVVNELRLMGLFTVSDGIGLMELSEGDSGLSPVDFASVSDGSFSKIQDFTYRANEVIGIGANMIESLLERNSLKMKDISMIIPQNTNSSAWNLYSKHLGISREQIFSDNFGGVGHVGDVDMIMNITDIEKKNLLALGDTAMAYSLGTGTTWSAILFRKQ